MSLLSQLICLFAVIGLWLSSTVIASSPPTAVPTSAPTTTPSDLPLLSFDYKCVLESGKFEISIPEYEQDCFPLVIIPGYDTEDYCNGDEFYFEEPLFVDAADNKLQYPFFGPGSCGSETVQPSGAYSIHTSNVFMRFYGCPERSFTEHISCEISNVLEVVTTPLQDVYMRNIEQSRNASYIFTPALLGSSNLSSVPLSTNDTINEGDLLFFTVTLDVDIANVAVLDWLTITLLPKFADYDLPLEVYNNNTGVAHNGAVGSTMVLDHSKQVQFQFNASYYYKAIAATVMVSYGNESVAERRVLRLLQGTGSTRPLTGQGDTIAFLPHVKRSNIDKEEGDDEEDKADDAAEGDASSADVSFALYATIGGGLLGLIVLLGACILLAFPMWRAKGSDTREMKEGDFEIGKLYAINEQTTSPASFAIVNKNFFEPC